MSQDFIKQEQRSSTGEREARPAERGATSGHTGLSSWTFASRADLLPIWSSHSTTLQRLPRRPYRAGCDMMQESSQKLKYTHVRKRCTTPWIAQGSLTLLIYVHDRQLTVSPPATRGTAGNTGTSHLQAQTMGPPVSVPAHPQREDSARLSAQRPAWG